jgi:hypothetical protein
MARRRKKTKKPPSAPTAKVDKSLPALPPSAAPAFTPDLDTPSEIFSEPPTTDTSPRPQAPRRNESSPANFRREASPASGEDARRGTLPPRFAPPPTDTAPVDTQTLPASTYKEMIRSEAADGSGDDGIMLPFALDPNMAPGPSPIAKGQARPTDGKTGRDYFNRAPSSHRDLLKENRSRSASTERRESPHIAFQEKGRQPSEQFVDTLRKRKDPATESPAIGSGDRMRSQHASPAAPQSSDAFKLQEVPKNKRAEARKGSSTRSPSRGSPAPDVAGRLKSPETVASPQPIEPQKARDNSPATSGSSYTSSRQVERPARGDSLANAAAKPAVSIKKDISAASPTTPTMPANERKPSTSTTYSQQNGYSIASPDSLSTRSLNDPPIPPARSAGRPPPPSVDTFVSPRAPPPPPIAPQHHKTNESVSTVQSETSNNHPPTGLPRYSAQGDFSQDEDFARLLSGQNGQNQETHENNTSMLRKVSNAMSKSKHGRSYSDRGSVNSPRHKKWPTNGSIDISSPTMPSPDSKEESVNLRNELRRAQQRIAELEAEKNGLEEAVHSHADIKQANTMLREKRNTITVLNTQREMVIRELEIMTEHLKKAKEVGGTLDMNSIKSDIIKDFGNALEKLKDQLGEQIEELIAKRTALTDEISNLIQMKDKGFQEYESLSAQNKKLGDMNNHLIESIQATLKNNKQPNGNQILDAARSPANGLGIYQPNHKVGKSDISIDAQAMAHEPSYSNLHDADSEATLAQPQVVNIRKTGKATKFSNWKKGGQAISKGVSKGFKGAFGPSDHKREDEFGGGGPRVIGTPYGSTHTQPDLASMSSVVTATSKGSEPTPRGWFGGKGAPTKPGDRLKPMMHDNNSSNGLGGDPSVLFGTDLATRCEFEQRMIPAVVGRCIEEVEARGMDVEGIYRKSGGNSQVQALKATLAGSNELDISDPDLDIHAVSSVLKAYLRELPTPLITNNIYDQFIEVGSMQDPEQQSRALHSALRGLPRAHYDTLQFLVFHLSRVIQHEKINLVSNHSSCSYNPLLTIIQMTSVNLAVVFGPTIMRPIEPQRELTDMHVQRKAVVALLDNHKNVFFEEE